MISVAEARARILAALRPVPAEQLSLAEAFGRVPAHDIAAHLTKPPVAMSAMDGYALRAADTLTTPARLSVVREVAAGDDPGPPIEAGEAVRIFTGGFLPTGADAVLIQEQASVGSDGRLTVAAPLESGVYVRPAGLDFAAGDVLLRAGQRLGARGIALAAAMNVGWLMVHRRPRVAILSTGNEIVMPGDPRGPHQIVSANAPALAAAVRALGAEPQLLGIARDTPESLQQSLAAARGADFLITTGGASVGKHDLVGQVLEALGARLDFWKIAMRPGKPLMFSRLDGIPVLGLPGNPVSALICFLIFARPAIRRLCGCADAGLSADDDLTPALLHGPLAENDRRQDYLRAALTPGNAGEATLPVVRPFALQDSSMLSLLDAADCLIVRPPYDPPRKSGDTVRIMAVPPGF